MGMRLQITTDYAIRMVDYLAQRRGQLVNARSMAAELGITYQYSMKVINQLKKGNIICSVQGCNGGYRLTPEASKASFYDVICLMEGDVRLNRCSDMGRFCSRDISDYCAVHKFLQETQEKLIDGLKNKRIVDVYEKKRPSARARAV
ncbi:MAG: Rrf2 family transcriptional regulator [Clostridiales Family XIII bacterium]|jgi:Rrf2 family protein|nr:Rrf2 family transcriptional regulator [Clostridiales Family XIII bacterium]